MLALSHASVLFATLRASVPKLKVNISAQGLIETDNFTSKRFDIGTFIWCLKNREPKRLVKNHTARWQFQF